MRPAKSRIRLSSTFSSETIFCSRERAAWILRSQGRNLHYDVTFVHDEAFGPVDPRLSSDPAIHIVPYSGKLLDIAERFRADEIVVAPDERRGMALEALITCKTAGYPVLQYMSFLENEVRRIDIKRLDLTWLLFSEGFYSRPLDRALKRCLDIGLASIALVLLAAQSTRREKEQAVPGLVVVSMKG